MMSKSKKRCLAAAMAATLMLLSSCSQPAKTTANEDAEKKAEPAGPPEPVTAKAAFWPMYTAARNWTTDFVTLKVAPKEVPGFKNEGGKAAMWQAYFASPSRHEYRIYSYSIASVPPNIYKGVSSSTGLPWGGPTRDVMPIQLSEFTFDSDAAYNTAAADAAVWLKKHPDKQLADFELGNAYKFQGPVWVATWGDKKSGYKAFVNASTGKIINKG
jgi:hypothetical protein